MKKKQEQTALCGNFSSFFICVYLCASVVSLFLILKKWHCAARTGVLA